MKQAKTVQKRSSPLEIVYAPDTLDAEFPVFCNMLNHQHDRPITFLHAHNYLELGLCLQGSGIFMVGKKIMPFRTGDVSFIAPGEVHLAQSAPGTVRRWTWIRIDLHGLIGRWVEPHWLDLARLSGPHFANILTPPLRTGATRLVQRLITELRHLGPGYPHVVRALVVDLMVRLQRTAPQAKKQNAHPPGHFDRLAPALQWMARNYAQPVQIEALAKVCGLSAPHFRRIFRAAIGRSPRAYWHDLRLCP